MCYWCVASVSVTIPLWWLLCGSVWMKFRNQLLPFILLLLWLWSLIGYTWWLMMCTIQHLVTKVIECQVMVLKVQYIIPMIHMLLAFIMTLYYGREVSWSYCTRSGHENVCCWLYSCCVLNLYEIRAWECVLLTVQLLCFRPVRDQGMSAADCTEYSCCVLNLYCD